MKIGKPRKWTEKQLTEAVSTSYSIRQVIFKLGLIPAGGNYTHVKEWIRQLNLDTTHFRGMRWNKGIKGSYRRPLWILEEVLVKNSSYQSYKLKNRLFAAGIKFPKCEKCGWAKISSDGRIPLELDHINGDRYDNRLENLQVLCPNCHSLQPTHRSKNRIVK
jgi:hypothetical protein